MRNIEALARELKIQPKLLYTWKWQLEGRPEARHADLSETAEQKAERKSREENQRLKEALADKSLELDFFRIKGERPNNTGSGASASTPRYRRGHSGKATDGGANVPVSASEPARILRSLAEVEPADEDMTVRDAIQKVALEHRRRYGYCHLDWLPSEARSHSRLGHFWKADADHSAQAEAAMARAVSGSVDGLRRRHGVGGHVPANETQALRLR